MSGLLKDFEDKARHWETEAETATEQHRAMYLMVAKEYRRLAIECDHTRVSPIASGGTHVPD
jgi:hypothetical protein